MERNNKIERKKTKEGNPNTIKELLKILHEPVIGESYNKIYIVGDNGKLEEKR